MKTKRSDEIEQAARVMVDGRLMTGAMRKHLRDEATEPDGTPKLFVYLNTHRCEGCREIIEWARAL